MYWLCSYYFFSRRRRLTRCALVTGVQTCALPISPVFIDSEEDTWNMDPQALEEAIKVYEKRGKKPKAIIPVHLYGMPAKMDEINAIAEKYGVPVLEDAAEALGSVYMGRKCVTFGEMAVL